MPTIKTLKDLKELLLPGEPPPLKVTVTPAMLPSTGLAGALVKSLPLKKMGLQQVSATLTTTRLTVGGQFVGSWAVDGLSTVKLKNVSFKFVFTQQSTKSPIVSQVTMTSTMTLGGVPLDMTANYRGSGEGWKFTGSGASEKTISVGTFLRSISKDLGATLPPALTGSMPSIQLTSFNVTYDTKSKEFSLNAEADSPGKLPLGGLVHDVDLKVNFTSTVNSKSKKRELTAHVEADLPVGPTVFLVTYDLSPTVKEFVGQWKSNGKVTLGINSVAKVLGITDVVTVPKGLDLNLKQAAFAYKVKDKLFTLSAKSGNYGDAFMTAGKTAAGKWGFVFGVSLPTVNKLSNLPVVGKDLKPADFLTFEKTAFLVASSPINNYTIPALPAMTNPQVPGSELTGTPMPGGTQLQLTRGVSLAAVIDFGKNSSSPEMGNLKSLAGKNQLVLQLTLGQKQLRLFAALGGSVGIPAGNSKLMLSNPAIFIDLSKTVTFGLQGAMSFTVNNCPITATARLFIGPTQAQVAVNVESQKPLPPPPGLKGLRFQSFGVIMGVYFTPPGFSMGLQGKFQVGTLQPSNNEFAIVLQIIGEVPNLLYLSFAMDELNFGRVVTLFTNKTAPAVVKPLNLVQASDLSFYWAENVVALPDGTMAQPGFGFTAAVQILSVKGYASMQMNLDRGIEGYAELSPINIKNVLKISGDGKGMTQTYQKVDGQWVKADNQAIVPAKPAPLTKQTVIVPPGGPVLQVNCVSSPFLHVSWKVTLFNALSQQVQATVDSSGFSFLIVYTITKIGLLKVACVLKDWTNFSGAASFKVALNEQIGPIKILGVNCGTIHLNVSMAAAMAITLNPNQFAMSISGSFTFQSLSLTMPKLTISVAPKSLVGLPAMIVKQIGSNASKIFAGIFKDADQWAKMAAKGLITGYEETAKVFKVAFKKTAQEAAKLMKGMSKGAEEVAAGLKSAYKLTSKGAAEALKGANFAANEVAKGLQSGYKLAGKGVAQAMKDAGFVANDVAKGLKTGLNLASHEVASTMKGVGFAANEVASGLKSAFSLTSQGVASVMKGAGFAANEVAKGLQQGLKITSKGVAQAMKGAGFAANQVASGLQSAFKLSTKGVATAMKGAGYAANEVAGAMKSAFKITGKAAETALKGAGYAANQVSGAMKSAFNWTVGAGKTVEKAATDVGKAVSNTAKKIFKGW